MFFKAFAMFPLAKTFILNLLYDNICPWQPWALLYGCVRVKARKRIAVFVMYLKANTDFKRMMKSAGVFSG